MLQSKTKTGHTSKGRRFRIEMIIVRHNIHIIAIFIDDVNIIGKIGDSLRSRNGHRQYVRSLLALVFASNFM